MVINFIHFYPALMFVAVTLSNSGKYKDSLKL